jgi:adenylyltransferase/sulfurtransferase
MINSERYHRQLILKDFGEVAQQKLLSAKVLVIGAGGLGCPALQYLSAAGVGTIGIVDDDLVTLSNLHRQILFSLHDIGESKAERAVAILEQLNPDIEFHSYNVRLSSNNAADIINLYDIVLDGSDNFATRYLVNDACVLLNKPLVYGAVSQYEGQVSVFNSESDEDKTPTNYRDLFPEAPLDVLNCEEAGVLGVVPGIIGTMMANETIKLITGVGNPLINRMITFDSRNNQFYEVELVTTKESREMIPASIEALKNMNYDWSCSPSRQYEISNDTFNELLVSENVTLVDVRELDELPRLEHLSHLSIPVSQLQKFKETLKSDTIVLYCQSGKRSLQAAQQLNKIFGDTKKIYSLKDGITQWLQQQKQMA